MKNLRDLSLPFAVSESITLDLIQKNHARYFLKLINDNRNHLKQGVPWLNKCLTIEEIMRFIDQSLAAITLNEAFRFGIFSNGRLIGNIIVTPDWQDPSFEIAYWIGSSFQGKGIITTSCRSVLEIFSKEFTFKKSFIRCSVDNKKSQLVAQRLGFEARTVLVKNEWFYDHYIDCILYEKKLEKVPQGRGSAFSGQIAAYVA